MAAAGSYRWVKQDRLFFFLQNKHCFFFEFQVQSLMSDLISIRIFFSMGRGAMQWR